MSIYEKIDDALDIVSEEKSIQEVNVNEIEVIEEKSDLDEDYEKTREKLNDLIDKGSIAIDRMMELATELDSPRAYEVVATLVKTTSDVSKELISLQESIKKIKGEKVKETNVNSGTVNNVFVGSTTELQRLMKEMKTKEG